MSKESKYLNKQTSNYYKSDLKSRLKKIQLPGSRHNVVDRSKRVVDERFKFQNLYDLLDEIEDYAPEEFVQGICERAEDMEEFLKNRGFLTEKQADALENMYHGAAKWRRD